MPDFPETTTIRAMKLRYHLAYASLLEDYERAYGSMAIDKKAERYQGATEDALRQLCRKRGESAHGNIHEMRWRINCTDLGIKKLSGKGYVLEDGRTGIASSSNPQRAVAHRHGHEDTSRVAVALQVPPAAGGERTSDAEATLNPLTHQHALASPHRRPAVAQAKLQPLLTSKESFWID